ncbi:MAG: COG4223 family protein [Kiloniellaceae bacterium]
MTASDGQDGDDNAGGGTGGPQVSGQASEAPALAIIEAFGGIRPMAKTLGLAVSTVQGWKERSAIPANRHDQIRAAARKNNIEIDAGVLRASAGEGAAAQPQVIEGQVIEGKTTPAEAAADKAPEKPADIPGAKAAPAGPDKPSERATGKSGEAPRTSAASAAAARRPQAPADAPAAKRGGAFLPGLAVGVVLAVAVAAATVYTRPYWAPFLDGGGDSGSSAADAAALADLQARLDALHEAMPADGSQALAEMNERLATLETALSQGAGQDPDALAALESLNAQLARTTDRIAALEQDVVAVRDLADSPSPEVSSRLSNEAQRLDAMLDQQSDLAARIAAAEADLDAAQAARDAAPGSRETLLLLATLQLRDALQGSGPYVEPLAMLKNLAAEDAPLGAIIEPLERRASAGLPGLRGLQARFPEVARRIAAIEIGEEGEGWSAGVLRRVAEAVNLRPVGLIEGDAATAVAARAEVKLNDGDLAGALAELDSLEGATAEAAASWRSEAEARLAADRAVSRLGALVSERFATMSGG